MVTVKDLLELMGRKVVVVEPNLTSEPVFVYH